MAVTDGHMYNYSSSNFTCSIYCWLLWICRATCCTTNTQQIQHLSFRVRERNSDLRSSSSPTSHW